MKTRPFRLTVAALAAVVLGAFAPRAAADQIKLTYVSGSPTTSISTNSGANYYSVGGGPFLWNVNQVPPNVNISVNPLTTYCIDLYHGINQSGQSTYDITAGTGNLPNSGAIYALFDKGFSPAYTTADSAAFQLALWELEYDSTPGSLTGGSFRAQNVNSATLTAANNLVTYAKAHSATGMAEFNAHLPGGKLYTLDGSAYGLQSQITIVPPPPTKGVPAPPAVLLAGFGLAALGGRASWLRRKPTA